MRSSNKPQDKGRKHVVLRRIAWGLAFLVIAITTNLLLTFALEPYGTAAEVTWYDYRTFTSSGNRLDTLLIGSSYAQRDLDPLVMDEALGSTSFNLATPAQSLANSFSSLRTVVQDHHISRMVLCIGANALQTDPWYNAQVTFLQAKSLGEPPSRVLENVANIALDASNFGTSRSLTWVFPWRYSYVELKRESIGANIHLRLSTSNPIDASAVTNPDWVYWGRGHGSYDDIHNPYTTLPNDYQFDLTAGLQDGLVQTLTTMLDYCAQNGVQTYVVIGPRPTYAGAFHRDDGFAQIMASIQRVVEEHGATYYDFNLAKPDFYRPAIAEFVDSQHLNTTGSRRFSSVLGSLIADHEANRSTSDKFFSYDEWDSYLKSMDELQLCYFDYTVSHDAIELVAHSITTTESPVEYQVEVRDIDPNDTTIHEEIRQGTVSLDEMHVVREFGTEDTFTIPVEGAGETLVCMRARMQNNSAGNEVVYYLPIRH